MDVAFSRPNLPQQARSRRSMTRMLEAAESLLQHKSWQDLTIQEVVRQANCSVGAFYGRFGDKDGLLHALDERYFDRLVAMIEAALADPKWPGMTLAETVTGLARLVVDLHSIRQGVLRTLILQARLANDPRFRKRERRLMDCLPRLLALILAHRREILHHDVDRAVTFGFLQMFFTAREMLLWPHLRAAMPFQGDSLSTALARAYLGYLQGAAPC